MKTAIARLQKNSTTVLFSNQARPFRSLFLGAAATLAPQMTADFLISLFASTQRFPASSSEIETLKSAHAFTIKKNQHSYPAWSWGDGPTLLFAHGWSGRGSQFHRFVIPALEAGYSVVTFDAPGHGRAEGHRSSMPEFARAIRDISEEIGVAGIIAHSFGALSTGLAFSQGLKHVPAVFIASPEDPKYFFDKFCTRIGVPEPLKTLMFERIAQQLGFEWNRLRLSNYASQMSAPLKVIQDPADPDVPWNHAVDIADAWPGAELTPLGGVGHFKILKSTDTIETSIEFMNRNIVK